MIYNNSLYLLVITAKINTIILFKTILKFKEMKKAIYLTISLLVGVVTFSQTTILMQKENGVYTVPCKVNGLDLKFIFDTGASNVTISLTEALFMLKNGHLNENDIYGTSYARLANGELAENTEILIKEIEIQGLKLMNVRASIVHELSAPLLLGQTAIEKLGKIQLDGNKLIVLAGNKFYDYSKSNEIIYSDQNNISMKSSYQSNTEYFKNKNYIGNQLVFTFAPILVEPDLVYSKKIGNAIDNNVEVLEKINDSYYKVKSGNVVGYLWSGWFKN